MQRLQVFPFPRFLGGAKRGEHPIKKKSSALQGKILSRGRKHSLIRKK